MNYFIKRKWVLLILLAVIVSGCGSNNDDTEANSSNNGEKNNTLKVAYPAELPTLDTSLTTTRATTDIAKNVFETLVTTDSDYQIKPMLAVSWEESEDGKTITFNLREGVKFHNGEEMLADDVVASMNYWKEESSLGQDNFEDSDFEAEDDYTVTLNMKEPLSTAMQILAYGGGNLPGIMPEEVVEDAGSDGIEDIIGTGPFEFEDWEPNQYVNFVKYEDYSPVDEEADGLAGDREAQVDEITIDFVDDAMTAASGLQTGEYDIVHDVPTDDVDRLEQEPEIDTIPFPDGPLNIYFNKEKGLFSDKKARQAILAGVDNESILKSAYSAEDYYVLNHNILSDFQSDQWSSEVGKDLYEETDTEKAKKMLDDSDYDGEEITIITSRDYLKMYDGAVALQQQLEELGMDVELENYDWPTLTDLREDPDEFDILFLSNTDKPEPTAPVFMRKDFAGWTDSDELDELIKEFRDAPSIDETDDIYDDLQEWFYDYVPVVKTGEGRAVIGTRSAVNDVDFLDGIILWHASKDE